MNFTDEALQILARRMGEESVADRAELETKMASLLGLILRTGVGRPSLVDWVQRHLRVVAPASGVDGPIDPEWAAPRLARLLCSQMLQTLRARCVTAVQRETVVA